MSKSLGTASIKIKNASFAIFSPPVKITTLIITLIIMSKITRLVNFKIIAAIMTPTEFNVSPKKCHNALFTLRFFSFFKLLISTNISITLTKSPITAIPGGSRERPRLTVLFTPPAAETLPEKAPATRKIRHIVIMLSSPTPLAMMDIFSLKLMPSAALEIKNKLVQAYPDKKDVFEKNYNAFLEELAKIKEELDKKMASKTKKAYMIYHPALNYFIKDYNVEEVSVEYEGKEPTAQQIKEIIDDALS